MAESRRHSPIEATVLRGVLSAVTAPIFVTFFILWDVTMRWFLLAVFTVATLIGLPRLADTFRENGDKDSGASRASSPSQSHPGTASPQEAAASLAKASLPGLVKAALHPAQDTSVASEGLPVPSKRTALVLAIKRELDRLGYYDGALNGAWNRSARRAARRFIAVSKANADAEPGVQLLTALRAAPRIAKAKKLEVAENYQASKPGYVPPTAPLPAAEYPTVASDDYLPPWQRRNSPATAPQRSGDEAGAAEESRPHTRRAHRSRHRRAYARYWSRRAFDSPF
ncbi:MAG: putative peptidoglycan binding domain-containing protein [Rhodomicrobium sp.]